MAKKVGIAGAAVTPCISKWYQKTYDELAQMTRTKSTSLHIEGGKGNDCFKGR